MCRDIIKDPELKSSLVLTQQRRIIYRRQDVELVLKIKHLLYVKKYTIRGANKHLSADDTPLPPESPADVLADIRRELENLRDLVS